MAYTVNGKVYTEHPLMDELVYNTKKILSEIVIKNDELALQYETEESLNDFEILKLKVNNKLNFDNFPFTEEYLKAYGFGSSDIYYYLEDRYTIPVEDRDSLVEFCTNYFDTHFEEKNDYYRAYMGLPPYDTDNEYWITYEDRFEKIGYGNLIPNSYIESKTDSEGNVDIDTTLPLHLQTRELISVLQDCGAINTLREFYKGSNYRYILYLQDKSMDLYTMRIAAKWDILYIPVVETLVEDRFKELYYYNRDKYLKDYYQDAYKYESTYYDHIMIVLLLCQTFNDIIVDTPEWYIRRDIFDIRSVQYFLDSYGVEFFPEIPLKYQIKIVKNLNKLIKYKSTNRNNQDILDIFNLKGTAIYKYYLYKRRLRDGDGYKDTGDDTLDYELLFVATEIGDNFDNYIKDNIYQTPYDDITLADKYWDGEDTHSYKRNQHLKKDFTLEGTKYMSIEYKVSLKEYLEQLLFFVGLMFDSSSDMEDFTIIVPSISEGTRLKISNIFLLLMALSDSFEGITQEFVFPNNEQSPWELGDLGIDKIYHDINAGDTETEVTNNAYILDYTNKVDESKHYIHMVDAEAGKARYTEIRTIEDILDWKKKYYGKQYLNDNYIYPGMFELSNDRVFGFNNVDKDKISEILSQRHSMFGFQKGFTLEDFGLDKYINPCDVDIDTSDDLIDLYNNNILIYEDLCDRLSNTHYDDNDTIEAYNHDDYKVIQFLIFTFFTRAYDREYYKLSDGTYATNYADLLKDKDYTLFNIYNIIQGEGNLESRKTSIRNIMNDTISILEYYFNENNLDQIFAFASVASHSSLLHYISLMINFFKSYKVYFIDPYVTYITDDFNENSAQSLDSLFEHSDQYFKTDQFFVDDSIYMNEELLEKDPVLSSVITEILDLSSHFDPDPLDDYDYDGKTPEESEEAFKDADGAYVPDSSQYPYIVLNGGNPQLGMLGLWDLDGSTPKDYELEFIDIDGGEALDLEDFDKGYFHDNFHYIIDGGFPRFCHFISNSFNMKIEDHQIYADTKISKFAYNELVKKEDGLYVANKWAAYQDFEDVVNDSDVWFDYYSHFLSDASIDVAIAADEDLLDNRITDRISEYIYPIPDVLEYQNIEVLDNMFHNVVDTKVEMLEEEFANVTILGEWTNLD